MQDTGDVHGRVRHTIEDNVRMNEHGAQSRRNFLARPPRERATLEPFANSTYLSQQSIRYLR
jgi:hypothetical protein